MSLKRSYLLLTVLGALLPYAAFFPFLLDQGLHPGAFAAQLLATPVSRFFAADVVLSAAAVLLLVAREGQRLTPRQRGGVVLGTLLIGPSFGLPCYLYLRCPSAPPATAGS